MKGKKRTLVPLSHHAIIERGSELQRAATCSKSSFVMFIREGQDNRNIKSNDDITDLA